MRRAAIAWLAIWYGSALASLALQGGQAFQLPRALQPGHDAFGREMLPLVLQASLLSSAFALAAVAASSALALAMASALPLLPRRLQWIFGAPIEFMVAFPSLLFALAIGAWIGPGQWTVFWALLLGSAPSLCRTLLARAREIRSRDFIQASLALGASRARLVTNHMVPHLLPILAVKMPALLVGALLAEASLSFLGLGFSAGTESWGTLLAHARDYLVESPGMSLRAGLPLLLCVWSLDQLSNAAVSKRARPELR